MNRWPDFFAPLIGRILVGGFFLCSGIIATLNFPATTFMVAATGIPAPIYITMLLVAFEVLGGILLIVGYKTPLVALILALFVLATTFIQFSPAGGITQSVFLEHMAIIGGLLFMSGSEKLRR